MYLSVPVGIERVEFNAQRVFNPAYIVNVADKNKLSLREFLLFSTSNGLVETDATPENFTAVGKERYGLGIFTFTKR